MGTIGYRRGGGGPARRPSATTLLAVLACIAIFAMLGGFHVRPWAWLEASSKAAPTVDMASLQRYRRGQLPVHDGSFEHEAATSSSGGHSSTSQAEKLRADVWALSGPVAPRSPDTQQALRQMLPSDLVANLSHMCGRCLYRTLKKYVQVHGQDGAVFVNTGDIYAMWTRDSAVQMGCYLPRIQRRPWVRRLVEGSIKALSFFILQDPWANAYNPSFIPISRSPKQDRILGRGGWVWTRNFELDSSAYYFNLLYNYYATPGLWGPEQLLNETLVHDAVVTMLQTLLLEQDHERSSPYRYSELPREGLGKPTNYTGLVWTGFRPSDDPVAFPFNIPGNMYLAGALQRLQLLNSQLWRDPYIASTAVKLAADIKEGIQRFGVVEVDDDGPGAVGNKAKVYAYEVDGRGGQLLDFDDPNLPSLLSIPLLGFDAYDPAIYAATRRRILSPRNSWFFRGSVLSGMGSPHTGANFIWPLAHMTQALTTADVAEQVGILKDLVVMAAGGGGVQHESVSIDRPDIFTRAEFGWAQAMLVVTVEQLLGVDCDAEAETLRTQEINEGIAKQPFSLANQGQDRAYYYNLLSAEVQYDSPLQASQGASGV